VALPRAHRLKSRQDFQAVFREGIRRHSTHFTLRALKPQGLTVPSLDTGLDQVNPACIKIGVSISTKVSKRAVVRNRLKRKITAALYQLLQKLALGWRLVVIVKPIAAEFESISQQFLPELEQLLVQAEVLNGNSGRNLL